MPVLPTQCTACSASGKGAWLFTGGDGQGGQRSGSLGVYKEAAVPLPSPLPLPFGVLVVRLWCCVVVLAGFCSVGLFVSSGGGGCWGWFFPSFPSPSFPDRPPATHARVQKKKKEEQPQTLKPLSHKPVLASPEHGTGALWSPTRRKSP